MDQISSKCHDLEAIIFNSTQKSNEENHICGDFMQQNIHSISRPSNTQKIIQSLPKIKLTFWSEWWVIIAKIQMGLDHSGHNILVNHSGEVEMDTKINAKTKQETQKKIEND